MILGAIISGIISTVVVMVMLKVFGSDGFLKQKKVLSQRISGGDQKNVAGVVLGNIMKKGNFSDIPYLGDFLNRQKLAFKIDSLLKEAKIKISVSVFILSSLTLGTVTFMLTVSTLGSALGMLVALSITAAPYIYLIYLRKRYFDNFNQNLPDAISIFSGAIKIGYGIETAMDSVAASAPYPVCEEFKTLKAEMTLGNTLQTSLLNMQQRIPGRELKILVTGLVISQQIGGNLSEILDGLEKTIRERFALHREIKALSSQGLTTLAILFCMPILMGAYQFWKSPEITSEFFTSSAGKVTLAVIAISQLIGFVWVKKIVSLKD